jgi:cyanate permease
VCLSPAYPLSLTRLFELHNDTAALGRLSAMASGIGITFGPMLLGVLSDSVGLGWATAVLPVFALCGLLTVALPQRKQPQPLVA